MTDVLVKTTQVGPVTSLYYNDPPSSWEHWILLISDNHHDSILCNRELELAHLEEARKRNADILYFGDLFDAMQGRFDPRRAMSELRPEYRRNDYFNFVVEDTAGFLAPYAPQIRVLGRGNHETAVLKNANIDLLSILAHELNKVEGSNVHIGGYGGWVRLMFNLSSNPTGPTFSLRIKYHHGAGSEAPVTRGVIQTNRQAVYLPDANVVVNGHNHHGYYVPIARERITNRGQLYQDIQHHIRIPGYKKDYGDGSEGWMVEKGGVPKPNGAWWLRLNLKCVTGKTPIVTIKPQEEFDSAMPLYDIEDLDPNIYPDDLQLVYN